MKKPYTVLAVDTSLDETSAAVTMDRRVISNVVSSQIELHKKYGGVVPIIAKRAHMERIVPVITEAITRANTSLKRLSRDGVSEITYSSVDAFAVTKGPGQALALEVGIREIQRLATENKKPLFGVNHMEGHLLSSFAQNARGAGSPIAELENLFPLLALLISGGHTQLVLVDGIGKYKLLGETLDDAVGEAFDKVGRMLGLGYPGGPIIEKLAESGNPYAFDLPIPMRKRHDKNLDFSYSGIKTAMLYLIHDLEKQNKITKQVLCDLSASFERVVIQSLTDKLKTAILIRSVKGILLGGGVVSNNAVKRAVRLFGKKHNVPVFIPSNKQLFTDNAAMIGVCAFLRSISDVPLPSASLIDRDPNLSF